MHFQPGQGLAALVAGLFVGVIVMLYNAVQTVIAAVAPAAEDAHQ